MPCGNPRSIFFTGLDLEAKYSLLMVSLDCFLFQNSPSTECKRNLKARQKFCSKRSKNKEDFIFYFLSQEAELRFKNSREVKKIQKSEKSYNALQNSWFNIFSIYINEIKRHFILKNLKQYLYSKLHFCSNDPKTYSFLKVILFIVTLLYMEIIHRKFIPFGL